MITVEDITTIPEFLGIREEWNCLLAESRSDSFFLRWEWLYNWWSFYGKGMELKILLLRKDGKLRGIAPLYVTCGRLVRTLSFLGSFHVGSDYLDFILHRDFEEALLDRLFLYLKKEFRGWDVLEVMDMPADSITAAYIRGQDTFTRFEREPTICPYLNLPATWEALERSFSTNMRQAARRKKKKFINEFDGKFVEITDARDLDRAFASLMTLSIARFREKGIASPFDDEKFRGFHSKLISELFKNKMLRLFFLNINGEDIAFLYNFKYRDRYLFYQSGFSTDWAMISPGVVIFALSIERAIQEGMKEFDFLRGNEKYKKRWTKEFRSNIFIQLFNTGAKNDVMRRAISMRSDIKRTLRNLMPTKQD